MHHKSKKDKEKILLIMGIMLIATNLRAPFTSIAPLIETIKASLQITSIQAGIIQTLPLLAFSLFSPISSWISLKLGEYRTLSITLFIITIGILIRSNFSTSGLYVGTLLIGVGIAIANVILPGVLKKEFPNNAASLTGLYALTMGLAAAFSSSIIVPAIEIVNLNWKHALLINLLFPLMALAIWVPQSKRTSLPRDINANSINTFHVWRSSLAWQVSLFFGLNSLIYYVIVSWLPTILQSFGFSLAEAGSLHGLLQLSTAIPGVFITILLGKLKDQRIMAVISSTLLTIGISGLLFNPSLAALWIILIGISTGSGVILGLAFISLRSSSPTQAISLSGMVQSIGYLLASIGAPSMGFIHDHIGNWSSTLTICASLSVVLTIFGYMAGKERKLKLVDYKLNTTEPFTT